MFHYYNVKAIFLCTLNEDVNVWTSTNGCCFCPQFFIEIMKEKVLYQIQDHVFLVHLLTM
jgi:hypothetical protein